MANGGGFGSGFVGGAAGNLAGSMGGTDLMSRTAYAGMAAGVTSWATGGDFATGFQAGASNVLYNMFGETTSGIMGEYIGRELNGYRQGFESLAGSIGRGVDKALNISGTATSVLQILGKTAQNVKVEARASAANRIVAATQGIRALGEYRRGKISGSEAAYRGGSAFIDFFMPPNISIIKNIIFEDNELQ